MAQLDWYIRANLKPRHMQLLVALDELRHLGKVAASLNVTQPAISLALGELERGLGFKLFDRTSRGVHPNVYGDVMIRRARSVLETLAQARDELRALRSGASGKTSLGALPAMTPSFVPRALVLLKQRSPQTTVLIHEGSMETLLPELRRGAIDLIVGRLAPRDQAEDLVETPLLERSSVVVVGRQHALAKRKRLQWPNLANRAWVLPPVGSIPREPLETVFQQHGLEMPSNCIETLSVHVIVTYLQSTDAIGILSHMVAQHYRDLGLLAILPLRLPDVLRPIGLTWNRHRPLAPATAQLVTCFEEIGAAMTRDAAVVLGPAANAREAA